MMTKDEIVQVGERMESLLLLAVEGYNGWKNYETWNVALWMVNNEGYYNIAKKTRDYTYFLFAIEQEYHLQPSWHCLLPEGAIANKTPDGVSWFDAKVDVVAINKMMGEL